MQASLVDNYRHPRPIFNCTHFAAWGMARRMMKLGWHNLRYWFVPPIIIGVSLEANDPDFTPPEDQDFFELSMFEEGGFLHEVPLNHYIMFKSPGRKGTVSINAGYLLHHFAISEKLGYSEVARLVKHFSMPPKVVDKKATDDPETEGNQA